MDKEVKYVRINKKAKPPVYETDGAAGADLRACIDSPVTLAPLERALVPTGLKISVPEGYAGLIYARSGLAYKSGIAMANGVGVVDSDYTGEVKVAVINLSDKPYTINDGDRIAQLVITPAVRGVFKETDKLEETARACGGFGSTGRS